MFCIFKASPFYYAAIFNKIIFLSMHLLFWMNVMVDYTPRNEVRGGGYTGITLSVRPSVRLVRPSVRLSVRPSVCRRAPLGKIAQLGIGCRGGCFVLLGQPHSSFI